MAISCFAIPLDGLPTRRALRSSSVVDSGMSEKSIFESGIGLSFPPTRRPRADDPECFFFIVGDQLHNVPGKHPDVYTVIGNSLQFTSRRLPHEPNNLSPPFRRSPRNRSGAEEHERGEDEWCAWQFEGRAGGRIGSDEVGESLREENRPDQAGHAVDAGDGALKLALFRTADPSRHEGLRRRTGESPEGHHGNAETEDPALWRDAVDEEADRPAQ
jgi:hypothetical protein